MDLNGFNLMSSTSHVSCFQPPNTGCGSGGGGSIQPGPIPPTSTVPVGQVTGPGALASTITIGGAQITGTIPASALPPFYCKKAIACLTPGSIPLNALGSGALPSGVIVPDVFPVSTVFSASTGILTTTLNNGTALTANIGITPVDQFLDTVVYVAATATLKLTMSNGTVKNVPLSDLVKVTTSGLAIVGDGTTATPVALVIDPASTPNVVSQSAAGLLITLPKMSAPWDCKQTIGCLIPGSVPTSALAPGSLPSGVTIPASSLPPTTVSNSIVGSGSSRALFTTVNGVQAAGVGIPDFDGQTLSISGQTLSISSGNSVTLPSSSGPSYVGSATNTVKVGINGNTIAAAVILDPIGSNILTESATGLAAKVITLSPLSGSGTAASPLTLAIDPSSTPGAVSVTSSGLKITTAPTTHTSQWTRSSGLVDSVNGVQATIAIPSGVVTQILGYNAAGDPVYQNYAPIKQFEGAFKSLPGNSTYNPVITTQTSNTMPVSLVTTTETLFSVTGPNQILVLGSPTIGSAYVPIGTVWDVKTTGNWVGPLTIQSPFAIDGLGSYVINKISTQQPSISLRWTGATWLIV